MIATRILHGSQQRVFRPAGTLAFALLLANAAWLPAGEIDASSPSEHLGRLQGQIRLVGDPPAPDIAAKFPNGLVVLDESLQVAPAGQGIANVFIYLKNPPKGAQVPPAPADPLVVQMVGWRFVPHCAAVRVGQPLRFINLDAQPNNVQMNPFGNLQVNWLLKPGQHREQIFEKAERIPVPSVSNIFPSMRSWQLVLDHPWFAITDAEGRFTIEGLPPGRHEFILWHERSGYLERKWAVEIAAGKTTTIDGAFEKANFRLNVAPPAAGNALMVAGPFDLEQTGNGDDVSAGRRLLEVKLAETLNRLHQIVHLTEDQRKKLERAGTGEIEHLLDEVRRARDEIRRIGADRDVLKRFQNEKLPALRERLSTGLFGPATLFGKMQSAVLTPDQREQLRTRTRAPIQSSAPGSARTDN